jgi:hypothetical protein
MVCYMQVAASMQDLLSCYNYTRSVDAHWVVNMSLGGPGTMSEMAVERDTLKQTICDTGGECHSHHKKIISGTSWTQ